MNPDLGMPGSPRERIVKRWYFGIWWQCRWSRVLQPRPRTQRIYWGRDLWGQS